MSDGPCLHCAIMDAISDWFDKNGERDNGAIVLDTVEAISRLQECVAEIVEANPNRADRRRAARFAKEALVAALEAERTGDRVSIEIPPRVN